GPAGLAAPHPDELHRGLRRLDQRQGSRQDPQGNAEPRRRADPRRALPQDFRGVRFLAKITKDDPRRFLHPETIARISRLDLRARHVVEGFITGMHKSPFFGHSVEFVQHRDYTPGDDIRHLDWKVWSKTDKFYIKQFEEETNLRCHLVVDVSNSMHYGTTGKGRLNKY